MKHGRNKNSVLWVGRMPVVKFIISLSCSWMKSFYSLDFPSAKDGAISASVVERIQTTSYSQQLSSYNVFSCFSLISLFFFYLIKFVL